MTQMGQKRTYVADGGDSGNRAKADVYTTGRLGRFCPDPDIEFRIQPPRPLREGAQQSRVPLRLSFRRVRL